MRDGTGLTRVSTPVSHRLAVLDRLAHRRDYQRVLRFVDRVDRRIQGHGERERLLVTLIRAEALAFLGQYQEAESVCHGVITELRLGAEHELYGRACYILSVVYFYTGDLERATENANLAHFTFRRAGNDYWTVSSLNWLGGIFYFKGDYVQALRCFADCRAFASKAPGLDRWLHIARENQARVHIRLGSPQEAVGALVGNRSPLKHLGEALNVFRHDLSLAYLCVLWRRFGRAERILNPYTTEHRAEFPRREQGIWHEYFGELELSRGRLHESAVHLERAIAIGEQSGPDLSLIGQSRRLLAQVRLAEGDLEGARAECERAYQAVRQVGERIEEGILDRVMGQVHERAGERRKAGECYEASIRMLRLIGARIELGRTLLEAARQRDLKPRQTLAYLLEAERLLSESGIPYWIGKVQQALDVVPTELVAARPRRSGDAGRESVRFVTTDPDTLQTLDLAEKWAASNLAILITGETGTGKDLLARYVHSKSPRCPQPFVDIDLSTLPESLWESELFGHQQGTFTGARSEKRGLLESADGGTVFLNEIGNLSPPLQAKLLEFLDTHEIRRLGSTRRFKLDVRLIAATNCDLLDAVNEGQFRSDLYFRLNEAHLHLAPLRERRDDIPALICHFLLEYGAAEDAVAALNSQSWVWRAAGQGWLGNARQLSAFVGRLVTVADKDDPATWAKWAEFLLDYNERVESRDRQEEARRRVAVRRALEAHNGNQRAAARELQMSEANLRRLLRRWGAGKAEA